MELVRTKDYASVVEKAREILRDGLEEVERVKRMVLGFAIFVVRQTN